MVGVPSGGYLEWQRLRDVARAEKQAAAAKETHDETVERLRPNARCEHVAHGQASERAADDEQLQPNEQLAGLSSW